MIRVSQVAHRYGHVLYALSKSEALEEEVLRDLSRLTNLINANKILDKIFKNPLITRSEIENVITTLVDRMNLNRLTYRFLMVLSRHRRLSEIRGIELAYQEEVSQGRSELTAIVTSSHPLSSTHLARLEKILQTKTGQTIRLKPHIDPSLLGGLVIRMKSYMVDTSVRTKMNKLKLKLERIA